MCKRSLGRVTVSPEPGPSVGGLTQNYPALVPGCPSPGLDAKHDLAVMLPFSSERMRSASDQPASWLGVG
jgi:hypothetical protein